MKATLALSLSLVAVAACGGDGEDEGSSTAAAPARPAAPQPARPNAAGARGANNKTLTTYRHVEELVSSADEAQRIRHQFRESDFVQDPAGDNRDPFRSYILSTGILDARPGLPVEASDICTAKQMVATNYSVRDLKLVGIVSRGLRRFALMQDTANVGQIVTRGDCVGKEKARVKEIGAGYVTFEVMPEGTAPGVPRIPEERSVPLYPEELPMMRGQDSEDDVMVPVVAPRTAAPASAPASTPASTSGDGTALPAPAPAPAIPAPSSR